MSGRVRASHRPPVRVWLRWAAEYQPGLTDARTEQTAKQAVHTAMVEVGCRNVYRMDKPLSRWHRYKTGAMHARDLGDGVYSVDNLGRPTDLRLFDAIQTVFSPHICRLTSLIVLSLSGNELEEIPSIIGRLTALKELYLRDNMLIRLSESIGNLVNLTRLDVGGNYLTSVPSTITRLRELTYLRLANNELTALPDLRPLVHLDSLFIGRNPLQGSVLTVAGCRVNREW